MAVGFGWFTFHIFTKKFPEIIRKDVAVFCQREMTGVEQLNFRCSYVIGERERAGRRETRMIFAPIREYRGLILTQRRVQILNYETIGKHDKDRQRKRRWH